MKRLLLVAVLTVALLGLGVSQAFAYDEYCYTVWKTGPYPGDYTNWFTSVGNVSIYDLGGGVLKVRFQAWEDYEILETHAHAAPTLEGIPHNNGGPIPGKFAEGMEHDPAVTDYIHYLDISGYPDNYYVVAHVVMRNTVTGQVETGWATDCNTASWAYPGSNWARFVYMDGL